jgi:hypothetical protein
MDMSILVEKIKIELLMCNHNMCQIPIKLGDSLKIHGLRRSLLSEGYIPFDLDMSFGCSGSLLALNPVSLLWFKRFLMSTNLFCFSCISHYELLLFKGL